MNRQNASGFNMNSPGRYGAAQVMRELTNDVEFWLGSGATPEEIAGSLRAKAAEVELIPTGASSQSSDLWPGGQGHRPSISEKIQGLLNPKMVGGKVTSAGHDAGNVEIDESIGITVEGEAKPSTDGPQNTQ